MLQLEVLEVGIEERLNAPPTPCLSCADWFLPAATARDRLDSLASASPVFGKLAGAVKGASTGSRGRGLFRERARRFSPQRTPSDGGSEGQMDAGSGSVSSAAPAPSPHSTPDSPRKLGVQRDSFGSGGSHGSGGSGGVFKVRSYFHVSLIILFFYFTYISYIFSIIEITQLSKCLHIKGHDQYSFSHL